MARQHGLRICETRTDGLFSVETRGGEKLKNHQSFVHKKSSEPSAEWRRARRALVITVGDNITARLANNGLSRAPVTNWAHENLVFGRAWRSPSTMRSARSL